MTSEPDIEALVESTTETGQLRRELRTERAKSQALAEELADLRQHAGFAEALNASPTSPPKWTRRKAAKTKRRAIATLLVTDTHFGEVVTPSEMNDYSAYNRDIAEQRLRRAFEGFVTTAHDSVSGLDYDGACVMLGGDIVTGYIHDELKETNDETVAESVVHWTEQLEAGLKLVADEFPNVFVPAVPGNHDRWPKKKQAKRKARDSVTWIIYQFLAKAFQDDDRVTVQPSEAADLTFDLHDHTYLLTHGDQFQGGSGISGALAPLMLGHHRKGKRNEKMGQPYDTMVMGHFHQDLWLPGVIVGNCLKGYDEYAYSKNLLPSVPSQSFWVNVPGAGPTLHAQIPVQDREAEGW